MTDHKQDNDRARQEAKERLTIGFKEFTDDIEREIDQRVAAAVGPLRTQIAELTERVLCLEMAHKMSPSDYAKNDLSSTV